MKRPPHWITTSASLTLGVLAADSRQGRDPGGPSEARFEQTMDDVPVAQTADHGTFFGAGLK